MSIIINVNVICKDEQNPNGYLYAFLSKEYNTTLIPMNGMEFEDFAWKNPRIIQNTTLCPENNCYSLWLGNDEGNSKEQCQRIVDMYKSHDWNTPT